MLTSGSCNMLLCCDNSEPGCAHPINISRQSW